VSAPAKPVSVVVLGAVTVSAADIRRIFVHLGKTEECSSWEVELQNWDEKYSPGGTYPLALGAAGHIDLGRVESPPKLITTRTEDLDYIEKTDENGEIDYSVKVSGRCVGEKYFRKHVNKSYYSAKGEDVVADIIDNFVDLDHVRDTVELIEDTSTTFAKLTYMDKPAHDILKDIASDSDLSGAIGYDFRVAPDGLFEFFPRASKAWAGSATDWIENSSYKLAVTAVRNCVKVFGWKGAFMPRQRDRWTGSSNAMWSPLGGTCTVNPVTSDPTAALGTYCMKILRESGYAYLQARLTFTDEDSENTVIVVEGDEKMVFTIRHSIDNNPAIDPANITLWLLAPDTSNYFYVEYVSSDYADWVLHEIPLGVAQEYDADTNPTGNWKKVGNPDWRNLTGMELHTWYSAGVEFWVAFDAFHFTNQRFYGFFESAASQGAYGLREFPPVVDEALTSDTACSLRAQAIINSMKNPRASFKVDSTCLDYGRTPVLAGDTLPIVLPNENVNASYVVESAEYEAVGDALLTTKFELSQHVPQYADYIFALRREAHRLNINKKQR
jgi:hypothetical protein